METCNVQRCSCGNRHEGVELKRYATRFGLFTHYYTCPVNGDPIGLAIHERSGVPLEISGKVAEAMAEAEERGSYVFMVVYPVDGKLVCNRHQWNFASDQFPLVVGEVQYNLIGQNHRGVVSSSPGPIQEVVPPKPVQLPTGQVAPGVQMFGDVVEGTSKPAKPNE